MKFALFGLVIVSLSCKGSNPSGPDQPFSLQVTVQDLLGHPVSGLRLSGWNKVTAPAPAPGMLKASSPNATSAIRFDIPSAADVVLTINDLAGQPIDTLIHQRLPSGAFMYSYHTDQQIGTRVSWCRIIASDTGRVLFRDSVALVLFQPDPSIAVLGWTSGNGRFHTDDLTLFPSTLGLPTLIYTEQTPESLGTIKIQDTATFVLTDTALHTSQYYTRLIAKGPNGFFLLWNPAQASPESRATHPSSREIELTPVPIPIPSEWKLYQNYPNPFN